MNNISRVGVQQAPAGASIVGARDHIQGVNSVYAQDGAEPAMPSAGSSYETIQCNAQTEGGDRCASRASQGTPLCIGHLRQLANNITPLKEGEKFDPDKVAARAYPDGVPKIQ